MKKTVFLFSTLLLTSAISFAEQQTSPSSSQPSTSQNHTFIQSVKDGWNSFIDVLAGKGRHYAQNNSNAVNAQNNDQNKQNVVVANPPPPKQDNNDSSESFSDSVKSGWNSMIDGITDFINKK